MSPLRPTSVTIGVAIEVPEPYGSMLQKCRTSYGDPLGASVPSHVTLLPPQEIQVSDLETMRTRLATAAARVPAFHMRLRGTGTFRPVSPVVFVAVTHGISPTEMLAGRVREAMDARELQFPFHPHVTVAQNVDDAALDRADAELHDFQAGFWVTECALYEHDDMAGWCPTDRFPLAPFTVTRPRGPHSSEETPGAGR